MLRLANIDVWHHIERNGIVFSLARVEMSFCNLTLPMIIEILTCVDYQYWTRHSTHVFWYALLQVFAVNVTHFFYWNLFTRSKHAVGFILAVHCHHQIRNCLHLAAYTRLLQGMGTIEESDSPCIARSGSSSANRGHWNKSVMIQYIWTTLFWLTEFIYLHIRS